MFSTLGQHVERTEASSVDHSRKDGSTDQSRSRAGKTQKAEQEAPQQLEAVGRHGWAGDNVMKRRIKTSMNNKPGPNKLECYISLGWKGLLGKDTLAYWAHSWVAGRYGWTGYNVMKRRIKTSMNNKPGPNKLECCITLSCKGLLGKDTLAYWAYSWVTKTMTPEVYPRVISGVIFKTLHFLCKLRMGPIN